MKRWVVQLIASICLMPWLTGCITSTLWETTSADRWEPANKTKLKLYQTVDQKDVLVRYDETLRRNAAIKKSRAFLVFANQRSLDAGKKPMFLSAREAAKMQSTPLEIVPSIDSHIGKNEKMMAMISSNGSNFTLVSKGHTIGSYDLPAYITTSGKMIRLIMTPPAVVGDATICATFLALFYFGHGGKA